MADSSAVDDALIAKLLGDPQLSAILPDGVYFAEAIPGRTRFVIVALLDHHEEPMFGGTAYEQSIYLVKAVVLASTGANIKQAEKRIFDLLHYGTLSPAGYSLMSMRRIERVRYPEPDSEDPSIRWEHRGGQYLIMVSPGNG